MQSTKLTQLKRQRIKQQSQCHGLTLCHHERAMIRCQNGYPLEKTREQIYDVTGRVAGAVILLANEGPDECGISRRESCVFVRRDSSLYK
jgi:hypothetical protein